MKVEFTKKFIKAVTRLSERDRERVFAALDLFKEQPFHPRLDNHALSGKMKGQRALIAGYDLRIIYETRDGHITVLMLNTGTHDEVY